MKMHVSDYKKKVEGCWMGKSIGGTLGAPFECRRGVFDVSFYTHDLNGEPLPNDDLDLQLVWLNVVEEFGRRTSASILGEFWLSYISPNWSEYGAGKNNLRVGLAPPLSGYVNNTNRNSCGSFIRSEIWACIAPGHPEIAVKYAYEDAIVDHSTEGVYGEIFFAAIESSAFVETDRYRLIEIGLSYIPRDSATSRAVRLVIDSYQEGISWKDVRKKLLCEFPTTFGMMVGYEDREPEDDVPFGDLGFDAPANVAITVLGWLYGEGDFGKSLCLAVNCGEDADCTAATLGAILGIINGIDGIPEEWIRPIGRTIKTISINLGDRMGFSGRKRSGIPKTIDELTDRVIHLTPFFLGSDYCDVMSTEGYTIAMSEPEQLHCRPRRINGFADFNFVEMIRQQPFGVQYEFLLFNVLVDYHDEPFVREEIPKRFTLKFDNNIRTQQWLNVKWHIPEGWRISPSSTVALSLEQYHGSIGRAEAEFEITPIGLDQSRYDLVIEIISCGRHSQGLIPIVLLTGSA